MDQDALRSRLAGWLEAAGERWPGLPLEQGEAFLAELTNDAGSLEHLECEHLECEHLERLRGADRYLAFLCARGEPAAIAAFEATLTPQMDSVLAEVNAPHAQRDEIKQLLRERFLVGKRDRAPVIAGYTGRGSLRGWVRIAVLREVYRLSERQRRWCRLEDEQLARLAAVTDDPELALLKEQYRDVFRAAFSTAMKDLSPRQRNLLRHYYLDGMTVEQLGALYRFHKSTATRQLTRIREQLLERTRQVMMAELVVGDDDCDSILRLIKSQLEISICSHLDPDLDPD
jgi:RNA polymerase sigma-70 factor (ECF subfamily)